jgi:uncharacterized membrane protein YbhN (UPF0104 family)
MANMLSQKPTETLSLSLSLSLSFSLSLTSVHDPVGYVQRNWVASLGFETLLATFRAGEEIPQKKSWFSRNRTRLFRLSHGRPNPLDYRVGPEYRLAA